MTKDDALKLALDALENHTAIKHPQQIHYRDKAIAAIKEALAQPDTKLYTHSQRTWVGLFDEEIEILFQTAAGADEEVHIRFARAIESKMKELNT